MSQYATVDSFDKTDTGYTNRYLEVRNDLKTPVLQRSDRMAQDETPPSQDYVYSVSKDFAHTPVSRLYFSRKNLDYIQQMLRKVIQKETGHIIGRQSDEELLIIMRSYYFSDVKNLPDNIPRQVAELNRKVIRYAVYEEILPKVKGYNTFLHDNMRTNVVLPHPRFVSMQGSRINRGFADLI